MLLELLRETQSSNLVDLPQDNYAKKCRSQRLTRLLFVPRGGPKWSSGGHILIMVQPRTLDKEGLGR